ncbi:unnamed protein product [Thlaspi arvense]|uniref:WPP domain-interacting protein 2 n=1 Tax=Thlaspi arvense TaxID=13288 RepID=A0AAU9SMI4_THLAR|nr:unnamed protein product [Thlaspi arvense]
MDLESESSALESVEDSGLSCEVETLGDKVVVEEAKDEMSIKPSKSPVETSPPLSKGYGLRKWRRRRRIRRDLAKDDTSVNMDTSKVMKRVLSGAADPQAKQIHFPGPDVSQDSLGSVGSVNNMGGFAVGGSSHGPGLAFSARVDSDNSEDRSSKSSTAASGPKVRYERTMSRSWEKQRGKCLGGKSIVEKSKKLRGEKIKIDKANSHSSMESADSRSSNFVFMQGASSSLSSREQGGRRMMDYDEENSDHEAHTSNHKGNAREEAEEEGTGDYSQGDSVEESEIKNNGSSHNLDPLTEAFNSFHNLQEALEKELQKFQELGKEPISVHAGHERAGEASSSRLFGSEDMGELGLTSLDSEILNLVNNVEHLEIKQEETKCILQMKESQIRGLESNINVSELRNRGAEIDIEDIFQQKMEAEIEYLVFSRSVENLKTRLKLIEEEKTLTENEAHKTLAKLGEAETKAENLKNQAQDLQNHCVEITEIQEVKSFKKRVYKTTSCLLLQLGLLFILFNFLLMPESQTVVVPT